MRVMARHRAIIVLLGNVFWPLSSASGHDALPIVKVSTDKGTYKRVFYRDRKQAEKSVGGAPPETCGDYVKTSFVCPANKPL
jgi:hypothetical protein